MMRRLSREFLLYAAVSAALMAFVIGHFAHFSLGFSRGEIQTGALGGAAVIAGLLFAGATRGKRRGE